MGKKDSGDMKAMPEGVKRGYAVVSIDYRLSKEALFPAAIDDVQKSILFVKENAQKYNLNPNKIATW
jgi:acetyl esterase/lipase